MTDDPKTPGGAAPEPAENGRPRAYVDPAVALEAELEKAKAESAELKDKLLRTLAEMENLRRRTEREVKDASAYAVTRFARDMLAVADNLRRGLDAAGPDAKAEGSALKPVIEGVELTEKALLQTLERHGVKAIEAMGAKFDPNLHQAMYEVPHADAPSGTVVQVVQQGFVIAERVLRPALVAVAKGGPKAEPAKPPESPPNGGLDTSV
jgi:molecular chaperone GrpE